MKEQTSKAVHRRRTRSEIESLLKEYDNSKGLSIKEFCRQVEADIYGSSRLGLLNLSVNCAGSLSYPASGSLVRGAKLFELSNHLGNVLATITDKKIQHTSDNSTVDYYTADVAGANDYYSFGMGMPSRSYTATGANSYRYGFNGQEKTDEITGVGNHTTAEFWEYDPRIGRRWNLDPKPVTGLSQYTAFNNCPIRIVDPLGDTSGTGSSFFRRDSTNYILPYNPVFSAPNFLTGLTNAALNAGNFLSNVTVGSLSEGAKGINNYFAGGYKESTTDPITGSIDWLNAQSEYMTHTTFSQQLMDLGTAATDLKSYEFPAQLALVGEAAFSEIKITEKFSLKVPVSSKTDLVPLADETLSQGAFQEFTKGPEKIGDYTIYGTKGLVGSTFNRNIFLIQTSSKSLAGFRSLLGSMEAEAIKAGAAKISIYGSSVINEGFLNPGVALRFGYSFEQSGSGVILQKTLKR